MLDQELCAAAGGYAKRVSGISVSTGLEQEMVIPLEKLQEHCAAAEPKRGERRQAQI